MASIGNTYIFNLTGDNVTSLLLNEDNVGTIQGWNKRVEVSPMILYQPYAMILPIFKTDDEAIEGKGVSIKSTNTFNINWQSGSSEIQIALDIPKSKQAVPFDIILHVSFNYYFLLIGANINFQKRFSGEIVFTPKSQKGL